MGTVLGRVWRRGWIVGGWGKIAIFFGTSGGEIWRISVGVLVLVLATFLRLLRNGLALAHCEVLGGRLGRAGGRLGPALAREARGYNREDSWSQLGNVSVRLSGLVDGEVKAAASNLKQVASSESHLCDEFCPGSHFVSHTEPVTHSHITHQAP